jgi:hypothetical protein
MPLSPAEIDRLVADREAIETAEAAVAAAQAQLDADIAALVPDADVTAPDTMLVSGPPNSTDTSATISFSGTDDRGAVTFEGSLDGAAFAPVTSPVVLTGLSYAAHTYTIRAVDAAGNVDPTPAVASWTVSAPLPDVQQDSPVPDVDWLEGTAGTLDVLSHFSSPAGKTLSLSAAGALPAGVTIVGGGLSYDGSGVFESNVAIPLNVTAA